MKDCCKGILNLKYILTNGLQDNTHHSTGTVTTALCSSISKDEYLLVGVSRDDWNELNGNIKQCKRAMQQVSHVLG